jgi:hypothetical protein
MIGAEHPFQVGKQRLQEPQRFLGVATHAGPIGDVVAGLERIRLIAAEHPLLVRKQRPKEPQRFLGVAAVAGPAGDVVADRERLRVAGAEHPLQVGEQRLKEPQCLPASPDRPVQKPMLFRVLSVFGLLGPSTRSRSGSSARKSRSASWASPQLPIKAATLLRTPSVSG